MSQNLAKKGLAAAKSGDYKEALLYFKKALSNPLPSTQQAIFHQYICVLHKLQQNYTKALTHARLAVRAEPLNFKHWGNLANLQRDMHDFTSALTNYDEALRLCYEKTARAQLRFNKALAQLTLGDYIQGTQGFLLKAKGGKERKLSEYLLGITRWNGESLQGKNVLIHAIEGYGDCLQWLRFVPSFQKTTQAAEVGFCPHTLLGTLLMQTPEEQPIENHGTFVFYKDLATALHHKSFDIWIPLYALLHLCHAQIHSLPPPWQRVFPAKMPALKRTGKLKIGLVWQVNPAAPTAKRRNIPFTYFEPLLKNVSADFYRLQVNAQLTKKEQILSKASEDLSSQIRDFADTAGWLKQMDLLITVDTVTAHLGASLGIQTWLLLSFSSDWRWMTQRQDSPWYPNPEAFRIFRQTEPSNWTSVIQDVQDALYKIQT